MLKLFRKIRQRLLTENKFSKYFIYAIGEIILVVIGILIALNINNSNDEKKKSVLEVKILKEISTNLDYDLEEIREDITLMDSINVASNSIIQYLKIHDTPSDEFNYDIAMIKVAPHFNPNKSGYDLMTSRGVEIVSNDSLRMAISDLYESYYPYYDEYEKERMEFKASNIHPFFIKHFSYQLDESKYFLSNVLTTQDDYLKIKNDALFNKLVHAITFENLIVRLRAKTAEEKIINLKILINQELDSKK